MSRDTEADRLKLDALVQPDVILPAQFHAEVRALRDSERRLRLAVLEDAIRYFQRHLDATERRERVLYEDAVDWFASPDRTEPFSFENVCEALQLDPDYLRQRLCRWRAAEQARRRTSIVAQRDGSADRVRKRRVFGRHLRAA